MQGWLAHIIRCMLIMTMSLQNIRMLPEIMLSMKYVSAGADMLDQYNFTSDALQETGAVGYIWRKNI